MELTDGRADISVSRSDGDTVASAFATPGCANDVEGYRAFQASRVCASPLQISEVRVADYGIGYKSDEQHSDWVELRNVSDEAIRLSAYSLTDDSEQPEQYRLPDETLGPGAYFLLLCTDEYRWDQPTTGFSLDSERESLYLYENGRLADYAALHDIPYFGSLGRLPDENGYYYFEKPTPAAPNDGRAGRTISAPPTSPTRDGVYEGTGAVSVELRGAGRIYYTLDGSRPNETSSAYTGPITVDRSTVVRAVAVEDGALPSPPLTLSFFLNEGHTLPIVSIAGDSPGQVDTLLNRGSKAMEEPGNVSLYEGGERAFSLDCGFSLSGKSSIYEFPKKNVKVRLRSAYGADPVLRPLRHGRDGLRFVHPPCRAGCGLPPLQHRDLAGSLPGHV
ncbi:MAG: chitobiase/beta-hexosaminidase C-terminal domain-containing protein [Oscillospiraceae bacterium]|nr:chitobiase/beta-hexosaminidase C-terminal domain-containing protein [Oscillospiraceae bacterium]